MDVPYPVSHHFFAETGLVVTPILPGDSLLFAAGAIIAKPETGLSIVLMLVLLWVAAILGDLVNYHIGKAIGHKAFSGKYRLLSVEYLQKTQEFYEKHGGKTIIYARFIPIIRTFAPFVAGIGTMSYSKFASFNVVGGIAWVTSFLLLGYFGGTSRDQRQLYVCRVRDHLRIDPATDHRGASQPKKEDGLTDIR